MLSRLMAADWVVYSKPCLTHTEVIVDYLARYSHRIALTDGRIRTLNGEQARLDNQDCRDGGRHKILNLSGKELIRRFLLHVLPKGFMRIRHFGFLANRCRSAHLRKIRTTIDAAPSPEPTEAAETPTPFAGYPCPACRQGRLQISAVRVPQRLEGG